jgi:hypothetical protein
MLPVNAVDLAGAAVIVTAGDFSIIAISTTFVDFIGAEVTSMAGGATIFNELEIDGAFVISDAGVLSALEIDFSPTAAEVRAVAGEINNTVVGLDGAEIEVSASDIEVGYSTLLFGAFVIATAGNIFIRTDSIRAVNPGFELIASPSQRVLISRSPGRSLSRNTR